MNRAATLEVRHFAEQIAYSAPDRSFLRHLHTRPLGVQILLRHTEPTRHLFGAPRPPARTLFDSQG